MRDPKRIPGLIALLTEVWKRNPDLRLGQVISNHLPERMTDCFYVEDEELLINLRQTWMNE